MYSFDSHLLSITCQSTTTTVGRYPTLGVRRLDGTMPYAEGVRDGSHAIIVRGNSPAASLLPDSCCFS